MTAIAATIATVIIMTMILNPEQTFQASLKGLRIWWEVVFPALLPFFIMSELFVGFGVVHFFGVLMEPLMRPLFNVPGVGAFVLSMGISSGYPIGAKLTTQLREQNLITRTEGERLITFTNISSPLFMFGAVSVGFFHEPTTGIIFAVAIYASTFLTGFCMRFYRKKDVPTLQPPSSRHLWKEAFMAMHQARLKEKRTFGQLLADAVQSSIQTLLVIGGLIVLFSVIIHVFTLLYLNSFAEWLLAAIATPLGFPKSLIPTIITGFFEITLGAQSASLAQVPLMLQVAAATGVIAWSGLSVHAQVISIINKTDIRYLPFLAARILQTVSAVIIALVAWPWLKHLMPPDAPVFWQTVPSFVFRLNFWSVFTYLMTMFLVSLTVLLLLSFLIRCTRPAGRP
jgi:sporulation integral membrane protein YlbJ